MIEQEELYGLNQSLFGTLADNIIPLRNPEVFKNDDSSQIQNIFSGYMSDKHLYEGGILNLF